MPTPVVLETQELIQSGAGTAIFQSATEAALSLVQAQVSKLAQEIRHGKFSDTYSPPTTSSISSVSFCYITLITIGKQTVVDNA